MICRTFKIIINFEELNNSGIWKCYIQIDQFLSIVQSLLTNSKTLRKAYAELEQKFAFEIDLNNLNNDDISELCQKITAFQLNVLNWNQLIEECQYTKDYFRFHK